jgi:hypothetical protein
VPFGCWRRKVLEQLGGFATDLWHAEDDELNGRLVRRGGRILLDPAIRARYVARPRLGQLGLMMFQYGYSKPFAARRVGGIITMRQLAPPLLVVSLGSTGLAGLAWPPAWLLGFGLLAVHLAAGLLAALGPAGRRHGPGAAVRLPLVYAVMHAAYGWGYVRGLIDLVIRGEPRRPARLSR